MVTLQAQLLGRFHLTDGQGKLIVVTRRRLQALIAYLLLARTAPISRQYLAFQLWPDSTEKQAANNLRNLLVYLRELELEQFFLIDGATIRWHPDVILVLDVAAFEQALQGAQEAEAANDLHHAVAAYVQVVALYEGDLAPALYDEWIVEPRASLQARYCQALVRLTHLLRTRQEYGKAIPYARQAWQCDPWQEPLVQQLLELHWLNGDRPSALRLFETYRTQLRAELGIEPGPEIQAVHAQIMRMDPSPLATPVTTVVATFVNRSREWQQLQSAWDATAQGWASFVLLTGEAGIGKTRLAEELCRWVAQRGILTAAATCYAIEGRLSYAPVVTWLQSRGLRRGVALLADRWFSELLRLLPDWQPLRPHLPLPDPLADSSQRKPLFDALAQVLFAPNRPLLLWLDDLQWCDHETLAWVHYLLRTHAERPLLIVAALRTGESMDEQALNALRQGLQRSGQWHELALARLTATDTAQLAQQTSETTLTTVQLTHLYQQTAGNPLFVIEAVRAGLPDSATTMRAPFSPTIQATIQRRLAQLSPAAREVAGLAAAIGREFSFALVEQAGDQTETQLVQAIDELLEREILYEQTEEAYDFTHDQVRQVAYHLLTGTRRRYWHRRLAQALTTLAKPNPAAVSGQVAVHYARAREITQAIAAYSRAATLAQRLAATEEAIAHLKCALDLLVRLPLTPERNAQELNLRLTLGVVLNMARRYGDVEVEQMLAEVYHLSQQIGDPIQRFAALRGLHDFQRGRSDMRAAAPIAKELLTLATQSGRAELLTIAYHELCMSALYTGDLDACLALADQVRSHYQPAMHEFLVTLMPWNPYVGVLSNAHAALYVRGYGDQARQMIAEALALAEQLAHPLSQVLALTYAAIQSSQFEAPARALQVVDRGMAVSQKYGVPHAISILEKSRGAALIRAGEVTQGVAILRQQLFRDGELVAEMGTPWYLAKLAEGLNQQGETDEAARLMALNFALVAQINTPLVEESELHRVWGEISWHQGRHEEARQRFQQAITIAQQHEEKLLELRATASLYRLCQAQRNTTEVYARLVALYGWFTEGFDLPDLQEAKALLTVLAVEVPTV